MYHKTPWLNESNWVVYSSYGLDAVHLSVEEHIKTYANKLLVAANHFQVVSDHLIIFHYVDVLENEHIILRKNFVKLYSSYYRHGTVYFEINSSPIQGRPLKCRTIRHFSQVTELEFVMSNGDVKAVVLGPKHAYQKN